MKATRWTYIFLVFLVVSVFPGIAHGQLASNAQAIRDKEAVNIFSASIKAGGGEAALSKVEDFTATGSITYFWAGREVKGQAALKGNSRDEFRMDSNISSGIRSVVAGKNAAKITEANGDSREIPFHNTINLAALNFPFISILKALDDRSTSLRMLGQVTIDGHSAYQIRTQRTFLNSKNDILSQLSTKDFFIDTASFLPVSTRWMSHPPDDYHRDFPQQVMYRDFRTVDGILVPFWISEMLSGQKTWFFQADAVSLNSGLPSSVFEQ